jgi:hypothetical protein
MTGLILKATLDTRVKNIKLSVYSASDTRLPRMVRTLILTLETPNPCSGADE